MLARVSSCELAEWIAFYQLEAEAEREAERRHRSGKKINTRGL